jgi:hypothetical protein
MLRLPTDDSDALPNPTGNLGATNGTVEFRPEPASDQILKFTVADGSADGAITDSQNPLTMWGVAVAADGNDLIFNKHSWISQASATSNGSRDIAYDPTADQVAVKARIAGWSDATNQTVNFYNLRKISAPVVVPDAAAGTTRAIAMSSGCGGRK